MKNVLETLRDGRAALRQLKSLAAAEQLVVPDFDRLTFKIREAFKVATKPGGLRAVEHLRRLAATRTLSDQAFDQLVGAMEDEFEACMGADPMRSAPSRPALQVVAGGRL